MQVSTTSSVTGNVPDPIQKKQKEAGIYGMYLISKLEESLDKGMEDYEKLLNPNIFSRMSAVLFPPKLLVLTKIVRAWSTVYNAISNGQSPSRETLQGLAIYKKDYPKEFKRILGGMDNLMVQKIFFFIYGHSHLLDANKAALESEEKICFHMEKARHFYKLGGCDLPEEFFENCKQNLVALRNDLIEAKKKNDLIEGKKKNEEVANKK